MEELIRKLNYLIQEVERLKSLEGGGGSSGVTSVSVASPITDTGTTTDPIIGLGNSGVSAGSYTNASITVDLHGLVTSASSGSSGGVSTATLPLAVVGSNMTIAITPTNNGGAVALQASSPGTQQTGNLNISGKMTSGSVSTGAATSTSVSTGSITATSVSTTTSITAGSYLQAATTIQATSGPYYLGSIPILDRGGSPFPSSGLLDGQRYYHTTYKSWFTYNSTDTKWRQEAPGVFDGSFPTVASGDNTVAPKIEVKRLDRSNRVYYWDGTRWLSTTIYKQPYISRSAQPFAAGTITFDTKLVDFALGNGTYITKVSIKFLPLTAQSTSNFYTVTVGTVDTSGALGSVTLTGNDNTKAFTSTGSWKLLEPTFTAAVLGTTVDMLYIQMAQTGSAGSFYMNTSVEYQEVG